MRRLLALGALIFVALVVLAPDVLSTPYSTVGMLLQEYRPLLELSMPLLVIYAVTIFFRRFAGEGLFASLVLYPSIAALVQFYFAQQLESFLPQPMMAASAAARSANAQMSGLESFASTYGYPVLGVIVAFCISLVWYRFRRSRSIREGRG